MSNRILPCRKKRCGGGCGKQVVMCDKLAQKRVAIHKDEYDAHMASCPPEPK